MEYVSSVLRTGEVVTARGGHCGCTCLQVALGRRSLLPASTLGVPKRGNRLQWRDVEGLFNMECEFVLVRVVCVGVFER